MDEERLMKKVDFLADKLFVLKRDGSCETYTISDAVVDNDFLTFTSTNGRKKAISRTSIVSFNIHNESPFSF